MADMTNRERIKFMGRQQNEKDFHYEPYDPGIMAALMPFNVADRYKKLIYSSKMPKWSWANTVRKTGQAAMLAAMEAAGVDTTFRRQDAFGNNIYRLYH